jgi:hypothetical protein
MKLIKSYTQTKFDTQKKNREALTTTNVNLYYESDVVVCLFGEFKLNYGTVENEHRSIVFIHEFKINLNSGDIETTYEIKNNKLTRDRMYKSSVIKKKNNFARILDSIENGFIKGEKRKNFWGVKYEKAINQIFGCLHEILKKNFTNQFYKEKTYWEGMYPIMFETIVDFHVDKKGIKAHDNIYNDIQFEYPQKKWLQANDNKFLPAVLDSYGIKSKFLIKELNTSTRNLQISSINYLCKLFGHNHLDYLKKIPWQQHCLYKPQNKRTHGLKNESEKNFMVSVINNWERQNMKFDSFIVTVNKLLSIREDIEKKGLNLKFKAKNDADFDTLLEIWKGHKKHFTRGYRLKYVFPDEFTQFIEEEIIDDEHQMFIPVILKTEEDFMLEGYNMRNCMSQQFIHAFNSVYISLKNGRSKINLQYKKGVLVQSYGKANTPVKHKFNEAIKILSTRLIKFAEIIGSREKYYIITN